MSPLQQTSSHASSYRAEQRYGKDRNVPSASTQSSQAVATTSQPTRSQFSPQVALTVNGEATSTVLLSTVIINIMDDQGIEHHARALLDSGSQSNFVSGRLAQLLRLPRKLVNIPLSGIGGSSNINVQHAVGATIRSRCSDDTFFVNLLVLPKPTANLPTRPVNISNWNIPAEYILADPTFNQPGSVDIMLGAEMFYELLKERRVSFGKHRPILQESKFGWIVSGTALVEISVEPIVCMTAIDDLMKKFFDIEELNDEPNWSLEERACEDFYRKTTTRNENEKYIVRLPRKSQMSGKLGDSKVIALRRFLVIERRLQRKPETRKAYIEFMDEYQRMGHMCKVPADESTGETFYLPHHPVFKVDSTKTKYRVVFDASSKSSNGLSLNDTLMVGPTIQQDATSILLRFQTYTIALTADVAKMYR
ncbi:uncharacterized protein LOC121601584, partial [Anopheles merus]|uniref:uncharacterized protein LOC121601584 n=1 Tax=Anopheles merus TaxID=30066 RepID=UPI001BE475B7